MSLKMSQYQRQSLNCFYYIDQVLKLDKFYA